MRVLHVFKVYSPFRGGIVSVIEALARGLSTAAASKVLVTAGRGRGRREIIDGVPVRRVMSAGHWMALPIAPTLPFWFWVSARRTDIVDYHYPFPIIDVAISLWFPARTALVVHWHSDIVAQRRTGRLLQPFIRRCLRRADRIIVATPFHIEHSPILRQFRDKCEVVPYGIDLPRWQAVSQFLRERIGGLQERYPRLVLAVGRLVPYKGFEILIRAMKAVDATLILVGGGPLKQKLQHLAEDLGVTEKVRFEDDASPESLKALMHACRMLVLPSVGRNEAFGMVQLEAMACSKPIINTTIHGGVAWVARDGEEAVTVPPGNVDSLSWAVNKLLREPDFAAQLGARGYLRAREKFSLERFCKQTLNVYQSVSAKRNL